MHLVQQILLVIRKPADAVVESQNRIHASGGLSLEPVALGLQSRISRRSLSTSAAHISRDLDVLDFLDDVVDLSVASGLESGIGGGIGGGVGGIDDGEFDVLLGEEVEEGS